MDHLLPGFRRLDRTVRIQLLRRGNLMRRFRYGQVPVTARPVRTTETGVGQPDIRPDHDQAEAPDHSERVETAEPELGGAPCRETVGQYMSISVVAVPLQTKYDKRETKT